jgi:hypothetical protein
MVMTFPTLRCFSKAPSQLGSTMTVLLNAIMVVLGDVMAVEIGETEGVSAEGEVNCCSHFTKQMFNLTAHSSKRCPSLEITSNRSLVNSGSMAAMVKVVVEIVGDRKEEIFRGKTPDNRCF